MNRLTRITAILVKLQSKRVITAKEIAASFDISLRTVYRDIKTLQESGVPIGSEAGIGYFIVDGYNLPPVTITEEEANALVTAERFVHQNAESSIIKNYASILTKIKSVLKNGQKEKVELLESRIIHHHKNGGSPTSKFLSEIQKTITSFGLLDITYHTIYNDKVTKRNVEPLGLYFNDDSWILIAFCRHREEIRNFRLDRILELKTLPSTSEKAKSFSLQEYFNSQLENYS
jgi:predicted DNA-binding transcriptional regulator YafY